MKDLRQAYRLCIVTKVIFKIFFKFAKNRLLLERIWYDWISMKLLLNDYGRAVSCKNVNRGGDWDIICADKAELPCRVHGLVTSVYGVAAPVSS